MAVHASRITRGAYPPPPPVCCSIASKTNSPRDLCSHRLVSLIEYQVISLCNSSLRNSPATREKRTSSVESLGFLKNMLDRCGVLSRFSWNLVFARLGIIIAEFVMKKERRDTHYSSVFVFFYGFDQVCSLFQLSSSSNNNVLSK